MISADETQRKQRKVNRQAQIRLIDIKHGLFYAPYMEYIAQMNQISRLNLSILPREKGGMNFEKPSFLYATIKVLTPSSCAKMSWFCRSTTASRRANLNILNDSPKFCNSVKRKQTTLVPCQEQALQALHQFRQ